MIERHISFEVKPDRTDAFERFFTDEYRPPALGFAGLIELSLLREAESATHYQMVFRWDAPEDAVAWRESEVHQALQPALSDLHDGMVISAFTKVA